MSHEQLTSLIIMEGCTPAEVELPGVIESADQISELCQDQIVTIARPVAGLWQTEGVPLWCVSEAILMGKWQILALTPMNQRQLPNHHMGDGVIT
jgi:hypothetical protein